MTDHIHTEGTMNEGFTPNDETLDMSDTENGKPGTIENLQATARNAWNKAQAYGAAAINFVREHQTELIGATLMTGAAVAGYYTGKAVERRSHTTVLKDSVEASV